MLLNCLAVDTVPSLSSLSTGDGYPQLAFARWVVLDELPPWPLPTPLLDLPPLPGSHCCFGAIHPHRCVALSAVKQKKLDSSLLPEQDTVCNTLKHVGLGENHGFALSVILTADSDHLSKHLHACMILGAQKAFLGLDTCISTGSRGCCGGHCDDGGGLFCRMLRQFPAFRCATQPSFFFKHET